MSIVRIVSIFPTLENAGAMRSHLEGRVSSTPGTSLSVNVLGEMPTFVETTVFDSLEAYEKARDTDTADASIQQHRAQIGSMSRQSVIVRLLNPIVSPAEPMGSNIRYNHRIVFRPTTTGLDTVRESLEKFAKAEQESGRVHFRMAQLMFGHDGSALTLGDSYETLAELENVTRDRAPKAAASRAEIGSQLRDTVVQRLTEVIVPANG